MGVRIPPPLWTINPSRSALAMKVKHADKFGNGL